MRKHIVAPPLLRYLAVVVFACAHVAVAYAAECPSKRPLQNLCNTISGTCPICSKVRGLSEHLIGLGQATAWIQHDNSAIETYASRQSYFLDKGIPPSDDQDDPPARLVARRGTGNNIAHGQHVIVVGGIHQFDGSLPGYSWMRPKNFSRAWPDVVAPTDKDVARPGMPGLATLSGVQVWMNGTSTAAPKAAGETVNLFATMRHSIAGVRITLVGQNPNVPAPSQFSR